MQLSQKVILNPKLFILPDSEIHSTGLQNLTYGSLTKKGIATITKTLAKYIDADSVHGFDLGCGDGELIFHLLHAMPGSSWEGVEISDHRVLAQQRDVTIWQGDFLTESFRPYNVLHADNLCLEDHIADALEEKIAREFSGIYLTYRTPENIRFLTCARRLETVPTETTWTTHPIHIYEITQ